MGLEDTAAKLDHIKESLHRSGRGELALKYVPFRNMQLTAWCY